MADFTSRLIVDNSDYIKGLADAKKAMLGFGAANKNLAQITKNASATTDKLKGSLGKAGNVMGKAGSMLSKYCGYLTAGLSAGYAFNEMMQNSQTFGDAMTVTLNTAKNSVNEFFYALGTGDFTSFITGIDDIILKSAAAEQALDQLGNTQISYSFVRSENNRELATAKTIANDKDLDKASREKGFEDWKVALDKSYKYAQNLERDTHDAIKALSEQNTSLNGVTIDDIKSMMRLDIQDPDVRAAEKERLASDYSKYEKEKEKLASGDRRSVWTENGLRSYDQQLEDLAKKHTQSILYNNLLNKKNDESWRDIVNKMIEADSATEELGSKTEEYNNALREFKSSLATTENSVVGKGSIAEIDAKIKEASKTYAEATSEAARIAAMKTIQKLNGQKVEIEFRAKHPDDPGFVKPEHGSLASLATMPDLSKPFENTDGMDSWTDKMDNASLSIENMNSVLMMMSNITSSMGDNPLASVFSGIGSMMTVIPQLQALTTAQAAVGASKMTFPASLIAIGTVFSTIAALFSQLNFADGGIVPGSNFHDGIRANVSSGEMFINQHDQSRLFKAIKSGNFGGGGNGTTRVSGEQLIIAINNAGRRTGKGTLVFK